MKRNVLPKTWILYVDAFACVFVDVLVYVCTCVGVCVYFLWLVSIHVDPDLDLHLDVHVDLNVCVHVLMYRVKFHSGSQILVFVPTRLPTYLST